VFSTPRLIVIYVSRLEVSTFHDPKFLRRCAKYASTDCTLRFYD